MVQQEIGLRVSEIVENGSTIQIGIGALPNAVLHALTHHENLGIHSEMFEDGIVELVEKGVITNSHKKNNVGKIVGSFVSGTKKNIPIY